MDPLNNNPTPNEVPATPAAPAAPVSPAAPAVNPDIANAALNPPVNPVVAPTAPAAPEAPAPVAPAPTPVAPAPAPAVPGAPAQMSMNQMFQPQPGNQPGVLDETTAISVPEGPKPVDPVEEELKAPLKAAAPAPGSIGSAVSGPQDPNAPAPAVPAGTENPMTANAAPEVKKNSLMNKLMAKTKMSKQTLILLACVAGLIVALLIGVLVMVATGAL